MKYNTMCSLDWHTSLMNNEYLHIFFPLRMDSYQLELKGIDSA